MLCLHKQNNFLQHSASEIVIHDFNGSAEEQGKNEVAGKYTKLFLES